MKEGRSGNVKVVPGSHYEKMSAAQKKKVDKEVASYNGDDIRKRDKYYLGPYKH